MLLNVLLFRVTCVKLVKLYYVIPSVLLTFLFPFTLCVCNFESITRTIAMLCLHWMAANEEEGAAQVKMLKLELKLNSTWDQ